LLTEQLLQQIFNPSCIRLKPILTSIPFLCFLLSSPSHCIIYYNYDFFPVFCLPLNSIHNFNRITKLYYVLSIDLHFIIVIMLHIYFYALTMNSYFHVLIHSHGPRRSMDVSSAYSTKHYILLHISLYFSLALCNNFHFLTFNFCLCFFIIYIMPLILQYHQTLERKTQ
jgi:hypothetical protein